MMVFCLFVLLLLSRSSLFAQTTPTISTCVSNVGTTALSVTLNNIASGQSILAFHKGLTTEPPLSDSLGDTPTPVSATNSSTGGCLNGDLFVTPNCAAFPCTVTVTAGNPGTSLDNSLTACVINNIASINSVDATGGSPYTFGATGLTGPITPLSSSDLLVAHYYFETTTGFSNPSTNYIGTGTATDIQSATLSNGTELVGVASEPGVAGNQVGLERTTSIPIISAPGTLAGRASIGISPHTILKVFAFPGA